MKKTIVTELEMTCEACPSQWEGRTSRRLLSWIYIRYRWGWLTARLHNGNFGFGRPATVIYSQKIGDDYAGVMSTEEMVEHLSGVLDFYQLNKG